jgi:hypothetical protein
MLHAIEDVIRGRLAGESIKVRLVGEAFMQRLLLVVNSILERIERLERAQKQGVDNVDPL